MGSDNCNLVSMLMTVETWFTVNINHLTEIIKEEVQQLHSHFELHGEYCVLFDRNKWPGNVWTHVCIQLKMFMHIFISMELKLVYWSV